MFTFGQPWFFAYLRSVPPLIGAVFVLRRECKISATDWVRVFCFFGRASSLFGHFRIPPYPLFQLSFAKLLRARFLKITAAFRKSDGGRYVSEVYRPSLADSPPDLADARKLPGPMEGAIPAPLGWSFNRNHSKLLIEPSSSSIAEFRASVDFIASIGGAESADTDPPPCLPVAIIFSPRMAFRRPRMLAASFSLV